MAEYRWNQLDNARGYDVAAAVVHPHYRTIQDVMLQWLSGRVDDPGLIVDLGGGSGLLAERILTQWPACSVCVIDQSAAFLTLAQERLQKFGERAVCRIARLQSDWSADLPSAPDAIVSMSAIHHLDTVEKQRLYRQCANCLAAQGWLLNGDEVRPEADTDYLACCRKWAGHMHRAMDDGRIPESLHAALLGWEARNVGRFSEPRVSGDDCHETIAVQLQYFRDCGFVAVEAPWQREMWAVMVGQRPAID